MKRCAVLLNVVTPSRFDKFFIINLGYILQLDLLFFTISI